MKLTDLEILTGNKQSDEKCFVEKLWKNILRETLQSFELVFGFVFGFIHSISLSQQLFTIYTGHECVAQTEEDNNKVVYR